MLTFFAVVCSPNKVIPFEFKCAAICAGPVSLATTNELLFINDANCEILIELFSSKTHVALKILASSISVGPGATIIWNLFSNLFFIKSISSL